jgi:hypothetical protein
MKKLTDKSSIHAKNSSGAKISQHLEYLQQEKIIIKENTLWDNKRNI